MLEDPPQSQNHLFAGPHRAVRNRGRLNDDLCPVRHRFDKDAEIAELVRVLQVIPAHHAKCVILREQVHPRQFVFKVSGAMRRRLLSPATLRLLRQRALRENRAPCGMSGHWDHYVLLMEGPPPRSLANLVRAVAVLALPAEDQAAWVDSLGVGPVVDELALELGDGALLAQQFVDAGWLGADVLSPLRALDALLKDMSGPDNASLWETSALDSLPQWAEVRERAKEVLGAIN